MVASVVTATVSAQDTSQRLGTKSLFRHRLPLCHELLLRFLDHAGELRLQLIVKDLLLHHRPKNSGMRRIHVLVQFLFEIAHLLDWEVIKESASTGKNDEDLLGKRQRRELCLFQEFYQTFSAIELRLRGLVKIAAKLCECRQFAVLRQFELERTRH